MRCPRCAWVRLLFEAARKDGSSLSEFDASLPMPSLCDQVSAVCRRKQGGSQDSLLALARG